MPNEAEVAFRKYPFSENGNLKLFIIGGKQ